MKILEELYRVANNCLPAKRWTLAIYSHVHPSENKRPKLATGIYKLECACAGKLVFLLVLYIALHLLSGQRGESNSEGGPTENILAPTSGGKVNALPV